MALPDVQIQLTGGNLGREPQNNDGVRGMILGPCAVAPSGGALMTPYKVRSLAEAEALGINAAYDVANDVLIHHHIREFYAESNGATPLWIIIASQTMANYFAVGESADQLMQGASGEIRVLGACYTPTAAPAVTAGFPTTVSAAFAPAQAFVVRQFAAHKPVRVVLEGHNIASVATLSLDLRSPTGPQADGVMVMIGQTAGTWDTDMDAVTANFASVGTLLGRTARISVHYNVARVKDGPVNGVLSANFSDATSLSDATDTELNALNTQGFVFFRTYPGLSGVFFNDDHMAVPIDSDYSNLSYCLPIDKAARIAYTTYVQELHNDVELDEVTGYMELAVVKNLESLIESAVGTQMFGEISGVNGFINPAQDIQTTDLLTVELNIVRRGQSKNIKVLLGYATSINA